MIGCLFIISLSFLCGASILYTYAMDSSIVDWIRSIMYIGSMVSLCATIVCGIGCFIMYFNETGN